MWIPVLKTITPVLDTAAYAAGDLLFNTTEINDAFNVPGDRCLLQSLTVIDEDSLAAADVPFDLIFMLNNVSLGTLNAAPNISDANASANVVGVLPVVAADYLAAAAAGVSGVKIAQKNNINMVLRAAPTSKDLWVGAVHRGVAGTHIVSGLKLKFGLLLRL